MKNIIKLGKYSIGENQPPFLIAEMSGNHNNSLEKALQIVDAAADAGAHALKIQTYTPDTMTLNISDGDFLISDKKSPWYGQTLYELYKIAMTPYEWHKPIFDRCKERGLIFLSTPFDETAVDFLEQFDPPIYKIASFENTDVNLIKKVASTGKPIIISTGMSTLPDLHDMIQAAKEGGAKEIILLKCTSAYPSDARHANIRTIPHLAEMFNVNVGLSDHTLGLGVAVASIVLGACVVEKHFTISRAEGGVDSAFSLEPAEFKQLVTECERAYNSLGTVTYTPTLNEQGSKIFRRSIYITKDIKKGEKLSLDSIRCIRPGYGLPPKYFNQMLGRTVNRDIKVGTPMQMDFILNKNE